MTTAFTELYDELKEKIIKQALHDLMEDLMDDEPITKNQLIDHVDDLISGLCEDVKADLLCWFEGDSDDIYTVVEETLNGNGYKLEEEE